MNTKHYADINAATVDRWVKEGWEWGIPLSPEAFQEAKRGNWDIFLSPCRPVPKDWFPPLPGLRVLGLAAGGGQQMPVLAARGADCTVLDYADMQLESDRAVARREAYDITVVKADMTKTLPFAEGSFDMILHPVSNCYIEDVYHVWREAFRVLRGGGILIAGMDNGFSYLFDDAEKLPLTVVHKLPFNPLKDPALYDRALKNNEGIQFSHSLEEQIGGQIKAGFILSGLYEDRDQEGRTRLRDYMPQYLVTRALKPLAP
jgi:SAM-dependent methyltransferase